MRNEEIRQAIVQSMLPPGLYRFSCSQRSDIAKRDIYVDPSIAPPIIPLLHALSVPPSYPLNPASVMSTHLSTLLFSHLLRSSPRAKDLARFIIPPPISSEESAEVPGQFFVPADGAPPSEAAPPPTESEEDDPPQSLLQVLSENLSLSFLSRGRADTSDRESREWDRLVVGYLSLLSQWLWEDPKAVREFLEAGGLGVVRRLHFIVSIHSLIVFMVAHRAG